ncbi:MAG: hypothetical protein ABSA51_03940 [Anaerolineaceae bacterium]|jgi:hypothetical protein
MSNYAAYKARVLSLLCDPEGTRYDEATLQEALRLALEVYSRACPRLVESVLALADSGREQRVVLPEGMLFVVDVCYPYIANSAQPRRRVPCTFTFDAAALVVTFIGGTEPQAGEQMKVTSAMGHTLQDLDGEATTSVPEGHATLLVLGAATAALDIRGQALAEAYGARSDTVTLLQQMADRYRLRFDEGIKALAPYRPSTTFPRRGFRLDAWSRN